jgi:hypothetical protein
LNLFSLSCLSNSGSVFFTGYGVDISLLEKPGVKAIDEGLLILINGLYSTPVYSLEEPWVVTDDSDSFYIEYKSYTGTTLELYLGDEIKKDVNLPGSVGVIRYQVPLSSGDTISGFKVISAQPEKENKSFKILGAGIEKEISGLSVLDSDGISVTVISHGFQIEDNSTYLFSDLSKKAVRQFNQVRVSFSYNYTGNRKDALELVLFSDNHIESFGLNLRNGGAEVHFYSKSLGFIPTGITVKNSDPEFIVKKIEINSFSTMLPDDYSPVTADIGTMLNYKQSAWRHSDWEIFSWNLFPDILVIDYRDYALQAASLKRLSFFVEKEGFSRKLIENDLLSGFHGWNAHDYRSKDLAAFFSKAEKDDFYLNPEEYDLLSILLSNKIIVKSERGYTSVSGGLLSYSIESSQRLRRLFITHEGYHGIYFSDLEFVTEVQAIWKSLEEPEKEFWYNFLGWKRYDINNPYLVVNEFMAYLMQQSIENVESYYKEYIIPKYLVAFPDQTDKMNEFLVNYPDHFLENAEKIAASAFRLNSISPGELRCIY